VSLVSCFKAPAFFWILLFTPPCFFQHFTAASSKFSLSPCQQQSFPLCYIKSHRPDGVSNLLFNALLKDPSCPSQKMNAEIVQKQCASRQDRVIKVGVQYYFSIVHLFRLRMQILTVVLDNVALSTMMTEFVES
jgi:hypothetical protein